MGMIRITDEDLHRKLHLQAIAEERSDANMLKIVLKQYFDTVSLQNQLPSKDKL